MRRLLRKHSGDDEGTVLILALAFMVVFGLVVGTVLGLATTNVKTTTVVRDRAAATYTADGAVDGAINLARSQPAIGTAGSTSTCFSMPAGAMNGSAKVDVKCSGLTGSGSTTSPFPANASTPANAILTPTAAVDAAEGVTMLNASVAHVQGPVSAAHTLAEGTGTLTATPAAYSPIKAEVCTGSGVVTPAPTCPATGTADPGYAPTLDLSTYPGTAQTFGSTLNTTLPTCPASRVVTFQPGMYTNLTGLSALMTACAGGVFYFTKGVYYFDFMDATGTAGAGHDWTLSDAAANIVGGTPLGWTPSTFQYNGATPLPYPNGDATATASACDPSQPGVLFVFGNDSRFTLAKGHVQLCAYNVSTTAQHLAVWSPAANTTIAGSSANVIAGSNTTDTTAAGGVLWTNAQNGSVMGSGLLANVTANNTVPSTLTEAASQYTVPTAQIPSTATITTLTAKVFETLTGTGKSTLTFKPPTGTAAITKTVHDCTAGCTGPTYSVATEIDLTIPLTAASPTAEVNGMGWVYSVTGGTSFIDGIEFVVGYTFPLRAPTGVVAAHPFVQGSATTDAVWAVVAPSAADRPVMAVHGTVYAPKAVVAFSQTAVADDLVDRGVIARHVYLGLLTPSALYTGPHLAIPAIATSTTPRVVVFTASLAGVDLLRAEVRFADATGTVDGTVPNVVTWSLQ
jgi:Tfp pilus assembly protein PilX